MLKLKNDDGGLLDQICIQQARFLMSSIFSRKSIFWLAMH